MNITSTNNGTRGATLRCRLASDAKKRRIDWLWPGHFAHGKISMIVGVPGDGKSMLSLDLAARVTRGSAWPDGSPGSGKPRRVLIMSNEDGWEDTIVPRANYMGADLTLLENVEDVEEDDFTTVDKQGQEVIKPGRIRSLNLSTDVSALRRKLAETRDVGLVIIDPLPAYLGGVNTDKNSEVRSALMELLTLAQETKIAVVAVMHMNKSQIQSVIDRASGSVAFMAVMRTAFLVTKDPRNLETRLFLPIKNNLAAMKGNGRRFSIEGADDGLTQRVKIVWGDQVDVLADDALTALAKRRVDGDGGEKLNNAMNVVRALLANGPKPSKELAEEAKEFGGVTRATLMRARQKLGVRVKKQEGNLTSPWMLSLPPEPIPIRKVATPAVRPATGRRRKFAR